MKALKVLGILLLVVVVMMGSAILYLNHYVQTPEFKQFVLGVARNALGSDVKIGDLNISLFSGVALKGVAVANPEGYPGQLLTADAFVLRYRLLPLLRRRAEVEEVSLQKPAITLVRNDKGQWNYERRTLEVAGASEHAASPGGATSPATHMTGFDISLSKIMMSGGDLAMVSEKGKELVRIQNIDLSSAVNLGSGKLTGGGKISIATINAANSLFVRQVSAPVKISPEQVTLNPLSGTLASGSVSGDVALSVTGEFRYALHLQVKDSDVDKLLQEAGTKRVLSGKLQTSIALEGTGGLPTMVGNGHAEIIGGKLTGIPLLEQLAFLLQMPVLRDLKFDECHMEFSISNNVMHTPVIRLSAPRIQITGKGSVSLDDYSLNHDMTLAVAKELLARAPKEVRNVFTEHADGFLTIDFRVCGPYDSPREDLKDRIARGTAKQLIEKGLQKLLKQ